jgi:hypothetical protein
VQTCEVCVDVLRSSLTLTLIRESVISCSQSKALKAMQQYNKNIVTLIGKLQWQVMEGVSGF